MTDQAARAFAEAFYGALLRGETIGEAVAEARQVVRQRYPDDPTWLAYRCFADPLARLGDEGGKTGRRHRQADSRENPSA